MNKVYINEHDQLVYKIDEQTGFCDGLYVLLSSFSELNELDPDEIYNNMDKPITLSLITEDGVRMCIVGNYACDIDNDVIINITDEELKNSSYSAKQQRIFKSQRDLSNKNLNDVDISKFKNDNYAIALLYLNGKLSLEQLIEVLNDEWFDLTFACFIMQSVCKKEEQLSVLCRLKQSVYDRVSTYSYMFNYYVDKKTLSEKDIDDIKALLAREQNKEHRLIMSHLVDCSFDFKITAEQLNDDCHPITAYEIIDSIDNVRKLISMMNIDDDTLTCIDDHILRRIHHLSSIDPTNKSEVEAYILEKQITSDPNVLNLLFALVLLINESEESFLLGTLYKEVEHYKHDFNQSVCLASFDSIKYLYDIIQSDVMKNSHVYNHELNRCIVQHYHKYKNMETQ